ncbi:MAG: sigma 54-interacting transcriptional regulator [Deltaproteobacteria bacterium]|nr:sigma 54-interacting transcriptional regulator [Deltaproteobacteria bacterium]
MYAARGKTGIKDSFLTRWRSRRRDREVWALREKTRALLRLSRTVATSIACADIGDVVAASVRQNFALTGAALYLQDDNGLLLAATQGSIAAAEQLPPPLIQNHEAGPVPWSTVFPDSVCEQPEASWACWQIAVPLCVDQLNVGLLALGAKESGEIIDDAELELLGIIGAHLTMALRGVDWARRLQEKEAEVDALSQRLHRETEVVRSEARYTAGFRHIVGVSPALQYALQLVEKSAATDAAVLISGETGTGKELIARAIHDLSPRRSGPLVSVNCPAIPADLAESELFGHERGAFTGAVDTRIGKLELADGGTIFLDEVADLPMAVQVKLLRVLQEREIQRVGSHKTRKLDIRIVAASNRDLRQESTAGRFREDLYFRLAVLPIQLPALRERLGDIPMLATHFLERAANAYGKRLRGFTPEAVALLEKYHWPGNVRELHHVIERAVLLSTGDRIRPDCLIELSLPSSPRSLGASLRVEKLRRVEAALKQTDGNQAAAARLLGMSRSNFARLLKTLRQAVAETATALL